MVEDGDIVGARKNGSIMMYNQSGDAGGAVGFRQCMAVEGQRPVDPGGLERAGRGRNDAGA